MSNIHSLRKLSEADKENVKRANSFMIDPRIIQIESGFNLRGMFTENYWEQADTLAHIEQFAKSYRNGDFVPPIVVKVINGTPFVRDGEHRLRALQKIIAEGVPFARVEVVEASGDELAQAKTNFNANNGRQWSAVERAVHYGRFKSYGMTVEEIANEVGHTVQHVYQLLTILEMPIELKRRIQNGDQLRKYTNEPYVNHCRNVAGLVKRYGGTPDMITAAWLHDVVEDTPVKLCSIIAQFGEVVASYVGQLTDVSRPHHGNRVKRKAIDITHLSHADPVVKTIKLCDLLDNTSSIVRHDPKFAVTYLAEKQLMLVHLSDASNQELYAVVERELFKAKYKLTNTQLTAFDKHYEALVKAIGEL